MGRGQPAAAGDARIPVPRSTGQCSQRGNHRLSRGGPRHSTGTSRAVSARYPGFPGEPAVRRILYRLLLLTLLSTLGGCADDVELPPAQPLRADRAVVDALYGAATGPHPVATVRDIRWQAMKQRPLELNLYYPDDDGEFPLLLFSHGNWSDRNSYDRVIQHWVSHGYVVIAPDHLDCCSMAKGIFYSLLRGNLGLIQARTRDLAYLLDALPELEQQVTDLAGRVDSTRIGIAGHSFGAFTAQQFGGAAALDPDSGEYHGAIDERVDAVLALNPPGPMFDEITRDSWLTLATPTLVSTGTWDVQPRFWPDWRMHLMSWETAMPGDKYALVPGGRRPLPGQPDLPPEREAAATGGCLANGANCHYRVSR